MAKNSDRVMEGLQQAPHRSLFNALGFTEEERRKPDLIAQSPSRRERVSKGSGRSYQEVNALVKRFEDMKKQMKAMSGMSEADMQRSMQTGQGMPRQKVKKGKGKGRGNFRI